MKTTNLFIVILIAILSPVLAISQSIFTYHLAYDFSSSESGGPVLIQIPNNNGLTGEFTTRTVPASTCGQGGVAGGYFFEDDAGLQFNNPEGFIDQSYSLAFNFQVDEFISPPPWVRILSFTHVDDVGVYIYLSNAPTNGTLQFWPYGDVGEDDFFNTTDFYQLILVRNNTGLIKIYINGEEFAQYDDSGTQKFVPADPDNYIVFFRDHPSVLANEASPGFVSSLIITNMSWSDQEVQDVWDNFCSSLLEVPEQEETGLTVYPNPASRLLTVGQSRQVGISASLRLDSWTVPTSRDLRFASIGQLDSWAVGQSAVRFSIVDIYGREIKQISEITSLPWHIDISDLKDGFYFLRIFDEDGNSTAVKFQKVAG